MPLLLFDQLSRKNQSRPNVVLSDPILPDDVFAWRTSGELSEHAHDRYSRPPDHGPPVLDQRVDLDPLVHGAILRRQLL